MTMTAKETALKLYNEGLKIAQHYTFPHAEHTLAKDIAIASIRTAVQYADENLQGWCDADVILFWTEVEQHVKSM